jgi:hypothetical protein
VSRERRILCLLMFLLTVTGPVRGQLNAENIKGDNGLKSGSQPPPCTYLTNLNYSYDAGEIKLPNRSVTLEGGLNLYLNTRRSPGSPRRDSRARITACSLSCRRLIQRLSCRGPEQTAQTSEYPDLYVVLLHLDWHKKRSDYVASLDKR